jgi:hypothetical protein
VVITIVLAAVLLLMLLFVFFPDVVIALAWKYSDQLPRPFPWVQQAILVLAVAFWVVLLVLVAWFQAKR